MSSHVVKCTTGKLCFGLMLFATTTSIIESKQSSLILPAKCQDQQECRMKEQHFALYSSIKQALDDNFKHLRGKDLVPFVRSVQVLKRRFEQLQPRLEGADLVASLMSNKKLIETMEILESVDGHDLINFYKSSINSHEQNLACSEWRVHEIELAAEKLRSNSSLNAIFANVHKNFVERSARKCLKTSCKTINDNMSRLDSVLMARRKSSSKRRLLPDVATAQQREAAGVAAQFMGEELDESTTLSSQDSAKDNSLDALLFHGQEEPDRSEFYDQELELCLFFKRTNSSSCQASGKELSLINFSRLSEYDESERQTATTTTNQTTSTSAESLENYLADYEKLLKSRAANDELSASKLDASAMVLAQCRTIRPLLEYHLFALRWYSNQNLIRFGKLESRAIWCPSLSYWLEIDRLCGQLNSLLGSEQPKKMVEKIPMSMIFAF